MSRDMTKREFDEACAKHEFKKQGFLGYYEIPTKTGAVLVSILNRGPRRRQSLAYLLAYQTKYNVGK